MSAISNPFLPAPVFAPRLGKQGVLGLKVTGELPPGTTATDLVLTVAELPQRTGVVGSSSTSTVRAWRTCRWPTAPRSAA